MNTTDQQEVQDVDAERELLFAPCGHAAAMIQSAPRRARVNTGWALALGAGARRDGWTYFLNAAIHPSNVVMLIGILGCESPQDKATDADNARREADQKEVAITRATEQKAAEVQQKASDDIARIAHDAEKKIGETELAADRTDNEATQALWRAREQARADSGRKIDDLDHDVATVRAGLEKALAPSEAAVVVHDLQARTAAIRKNILALDQCTAADFESVKRSIHTGFTDLEQALADAKKRV